MSRIPNPDGPDILDVAMGQRIRERRRALGIAQKDLADAVGVTFQQVQKYERGANRISYSRLAAIAKVLQCTVAQLSEGLEMEHVDKAFERQVNLAAEDGAVDLLEAYASLPERLRRALLDHARALSGALNVSDSGKKSRS